MKRVCMLGTSPDSKGGIGTVVRGFVEDIHPEGYSLKHIITHADCGPVAKASIAGAALVRCALSMRRPSYDLVHVHSAFGASFTRSIPFIRMASERGLPLVNHIHADDWGPFYDEATAEKKRRIVEVYSSCDRIIALSQEWAETLSTVVSEDRIVVLENFSPVYDADYVPDWDGKTVVFMSRLERIKGCDILPEICDRTLARIPDARFLICGEGSMADSLRAELRERRLDDRVELLGWIDGERKIDILKQGAVFLLPSYGEGMPMCVLEAMGLGLPVVATNVGGIPQLINDMKNGCICEPGDAESISKALVALLSNPKKCSAMSSEAKKSAEARSISAYSKQLKAIYDELLEASR